MDKFEGFDDPTQNWSKLPHLLIDNLHLMTSEAEVKIVLYILRHTWGFGDDQKKITIDEFANGRKRRDGSRFDSGVGLSVNAVKSGIKNAIEHGFIQMVEDASDKARIKRYYQLRGSESGGQILTPWVSEVDPLVSDSDPRTEKDTNRNKPKIDSRPPVIPALKIFVDVTGKHSLSKPQIKELNKKIGTDPDNLKKWGEVVHAWVVLHGYKAANLAGMFEWYDKGIPQFNNGNGREKTPAIVAGPVNDEYGGYYA